MKLILGLYEVTDGEILCKDNVRKVAAYVPQDALLFNGSILDNISFGSEAATRQDVIHASKLANAEEFILELKDGYDTVLLDGGNNLSGGQKKRIAIARALVKDTPILLLDEITSALDKETEKSVIQTIKEISKQKAVLFITHKDNVFDWADEVMRVETL